MKIRDDREDRGYRQGRRNEGKMLELLGKEERRREKSGRTGKWKRGVEMTNKKKEKTKKDMRRKMKKIEKRQGRRGGVQMLEMCGRREIEGKELEYSEMEERSGSEGNKNRGDVG